MEKRPPGEGVGRKSKAADLAVYRATSFGDRKVVSKEVEFEGTGGSTVVPYEGLGGDGDYVAEVSLGEESGSSGGGAAGVTLAGSAGDTSGEAFTRGEGEGREVRPGERGDVPATYALY